ncbi:hypothetical protein KKP04_11185 [Rhodomicrobium sp. Az07]|uniref:cyclic GMP-AMP synthase DncV-like nucleotidyltransferase n=1 Tax=Rhodomicrobium sp. Az07 TaxID=2839034 RepID=UPI001BE837CB|nr:hypothetical protein [Rhodomicrobium sp. Az07]MBT3071427.1 hypothetical protein [Rhodomicrobium sp. Az07]
MYNTSALILSFYSDAVALPSEDVTAMRKRRNSNRDRVRSNLAAADKPKLIGMHSQGSYSMHTMIQEASNDYDIDDGIYFRKEDLVGPKGGELSALQVRQMICDAAQDDRFKKAPEVLKNCVRVYYNEGYHIDLPSYRRVIERNPWTGQEEKKYELASADWKTSDPRAVTDWFKRQNKALSPDFEESEGQFLRVVKLLKAFARSRTSWKGQIATGFMITKLTSDNFVKYAGRDDESLIRTCKAIESRLQTQKLITHPTLNENINREEDGRPEFFRLQLEEKLAHLDILNDPECTHAQAMAAWDKFFASDWFAKQPEPEGKKAFAEALGAPSAAVQKQGGGRYGKRFG